MFLTVPECGQALGWKCKGTSMCVALSPNQLRVILFVIVFIVIPTSDILIHYAYSFRLVSHSSWQPVYLMVNITRKLSNILYMFVASPATGAIVKFKDWKFSPLLVSSFLGKQTSFDVSKLLMEVVAFLRPDCKLNVILLVWLSKIDVRCSDFRRPIFGRLSK